MPWCEGDGKDEKMLCIGRHTPEREMICLREICVQCEKCHLHNDTWIYFHTAESFRRRESGKEFIYFGQAFAIQKKIFFWLVGSESSRMQISHGNLHTSENITKWMSLFECRDTLLKYSKFLQHQPELALLPITSRRLRQIHRVPFFVPFQCRLIEVNWKQPKTTKKLNWGCCYYCCRCCGEQNKKGISVIPNAWGAFAASTIANPTYYAVIIADSAEKPFVIDCSGDVLAHLHAKLFTQRSNVCME